jgi:5-methylcytosine-specific restriction endonuclease McrA
MSEALTGMKRPLGYRSASTRPDVAAKIQEWWTPERREAKRLEMLKRNPQARYHGLSAKAAARIVKSVGHCQRCAHDGSDSRLGIHHKDRNKQNQKPSNLEVLCHRCHMQEHAKAGETGWQRYHQKRS